MKFRLTKNMKIAVACRGGPENGPFSAKAVQILAKGLARQNLNISAIYAVSGSTPTALLGCIGEYDQLCDIWLSLTPNQIVGKFSKLRGSANLIRGSSILSSKSLEEVLRASTNLDEIFNAPMNIYIGAVDLLIPSPIIVFTNRNSTHRDNLINGVMGSMAVAPYFPPIFIDNPYKYGLVDDPERKELFLIDGAYKKNIMLEHAVKAGYDVVFMVDIHGLKTSPADLDSPFRWPYILTKATHILMESNDNGQWDSVRRVNEEITVRDELKSAIMNLPPQDRALFDSVMSRMNIGDLRLINKKRVETFLISKPDSSRLFNFASFKKAEVPFLLEAGRLAAIDTLKKVNINTHGL